MDYTLTDKVALPLDMRGLLPLERYLDIEPPSFFVADYLSTYPDAFSPPYPSTTEGFCYELVTHSRLLIQHSNSGAIDA